MKRRIRILFLWTLLLVAMASFAASRIRIPQSENGEFDIPESAIARTVFVLNNHTWTTFRVPANANRLTILSRALFDKDVTELPDHHFPYTIGYRLENLHGETVSEGSFQLHGNYIPMVDESGRPEPAAFFSDRQSLVSTSRSSSLEIPQGELLILRVRLVSSDPAVSSVPIYTFQTREVDQERPGYLWNRLNQKTLSRIAERRVHSLTDISPEEQLNVLRNRPVPLGAYGVAGSDFEQATLYIRNDLVPAQRYLIEPLGVGDIRCSPTRRAVIGIPHPGGRIRFEIRPSEDLNKLKPHQITARYFGQTIYQRDSIQREIDSQMTEFSLELDPGIVEFESPIPVTIRPFFEGSDHREHLLEPDPTLVRTWRIEPGKGATFSRNPYNREAGFFRIGARPGTSGTTTMNYTLLDEAGTPLQSGSRRIEAIPSLYDIELTPEAELPVQDPVNVILMLSPDVAAIKVESDAPLLLSGYSRPSHLIHRTRVPADYIKALPDPDRLPTWFGIRPDHAEELVRSHRSHLLQVQVRPPEDDADILAGKYQWQDFQPVNGVAQNLFIERNPLSPARVEALSSLYAPVQVGQGGQISPEHPPGFHRPNRRLAFTREGVTPKDVTLYIDDVPFFKRSLVTSCGEILLPPFPENFRTAHVESEATGLQCFLNYIKPDTATRLKRRAQRVSPGSALEYHCEKISPGEELLTGMLFASHGDTDLSQISVSIKPGDGAGFLKESESYTSRERYYEVTANRTSRTPVLGGANPSVDGGRRFFIPFGSDMTPGIYVVTIRYQSGPGGFLTLSKVLGGEYTTARFFRETNR